MRKLVHQAFERATTILRDCASIHVQAAKRLLEKETFGEEELADIRTAVQTLRGMKSAAK